MSSNMSVRGTGEHYTGDLRQDLIDAAAHLLAEQHPQVSLREIARRAGVSHAAPAHHFGDRAGLFTAVATEGFTRFDRHLRAALTTVASTPTGQLAALGRAYAQFADEYPGHFAVMFQPALIHSTDSAFAAAGDAAFGTLHRHIQDCQRAGWRRNADSRVLAAAAWSLAHGISALRAQGSLAKHCPDTTLDGVEALINVLVNE